MKDPGKHIDNLHNTFRTELEKKRLSFALRAFLDLYDIAVGLLKRNNELGKIRLEDSDRWRENNYMRSRLKDALSEIHPPESPNENAAHEVIRSILDVVDNPMVDREESQKIILAYFSEKS